MPTPGSRQGTVVLVVLAVLATSCVPGCSDGRAAELSGDAMRSALPEEVVQVLPEGAVLCAREHQRSPATYELWVFRGPSGAALKPPPNPEEFRSLSLPHETLGRILASRAPWLRPGAPGDGACRLLRWADGGAEFQVREMVTEEGWFASIERITH